MWRFVAMGRVVLLDTPMLPPDLGPFPDIDFGHGARIVFARVCGWLVWVCVCGLAGWCGLLGCFGMADWLDGLWVGWVVCWCVRLVG